MDHGWFAVDEVDDATFVIDEPQHVRSHLILGDSTAVLFDSGLGVAPIRPVVESLTDLPVLVVNSHHHFDHVGGNHEFDEVAIHRDGVALLAAGPQAGWVEAYWKGVGEWMAALVERDGEPDPATRSRPRPLPDFFDPSRPRVVTGAATRSLHDGEVLDLGGRTLEVRHTPGHTQDSICLIDATNGMMFGGDSVDRGAIYAHLPTADLEAFVDSVTRLRDDLPESLDLVLSPHGARGRESRALIGELAEALERASRTDAVFEPGTDCFLQTAAVMRHESFAVYRPAALLASDGPTSDRSTG